MRRRNDPAPEQTLVQMPVEDLTPAPRRTRRTLRRRIAEATRSIIRFGFRASILVDRAGRVMDGHVELEAARACGAVTIPCIVIDDLSDREIRRLALSPNRLQETGEQDRDALRLEIADLVEIDGDLDVPGFEPPEIEALVFDAGDLAEFAKASGEMSRPEFTSLLSATLGGAARALAPGGVLHT